MTTTIDDRRLHDIYRMRDLSGRLLYIGVTNGGLRRFMEHAKDKTWWREVAQIDIEHIHCSRTVIESIEREAIKAEAPLYNVTHNERFAEKLPPPPMPHHCDTEGHCPTDPHFVEAIRPHYDDLGEQSRQWVASILAPHEFVGDKKSSTVRGALQLAVLTLIANEQIDHFGDGITDHAARRLLFIMHGGWGAPFDSFHEVSASDCVAILRTHFDPIDVEAIGYHGQELCAIEAQRAAA